MVFLNILSGIETCWPRESRHAKFPELPILTSYSGAAPLAVLGQATPMFGLDCREILENNGELSRGQLKSESLKRMNIGLKRE